MERKTGRWLTALLLIPVLALASASSGPPAGGPACVTAEASTAAARPCCKICRKGKACGDSCIARDKVCHQPPGCACDG